MVEAPVRLSEISDYLAARSDLWIDRATMIAFIVVVALVSRWALYRVIERVVRGAVEGVLPSRFAKFSPSAVGSLGRSAEQTNAPLNANRREQRARTMGSLLKSIVTGVIVAIAVTAILSEVGVNVAPILASAGILGVAIGFGAQSLVKDFLSGVFMIFEDQYGVGDAVDLGEAVGTVEAVSLRITRVRDVNGTVWYVRNGEILRVGNQSQNWARTVLDIPVSYQSDLPKVREVLKDVAHDLWDDEDFEGVVLEEPEVWGVEALSPDAVTMRVTLKTAPLQQWRVARAMRERIKARFDHEGIEIPHPQRVIWHRNNEPIAAEEPTRD